MHRSYAIIPAAGRSSRMGARKLLMPWGESTVIEHVLGVWRASSVTRVVVVVCPGDEDLPALCGPCGAEVVVPPSPPEDMKASVRFGLEFITRTWLPQPSDVWLLAPADMPRLSSRIIDQLVELHDPNHPRIIVPANQGKRGHPVLFPWPAAEAVHQLAAHEGVNALLARYALRTIECDDPGIFHDLDTPEDYRRLRE